MMENEPRSRVAELEDQVLSADWNPQRIIVLDQVPSIDIPVCNARPAVADRAA